MKQIKRQFIESYITTLSEALNIYNESELEVTKQAESDLFDVIMQIRNVFSEVLPNIDDVILLRNGTALRDANSVLGILKLYLIDNDTDHSTTISIEEKTAHKIFISHSTLDMYYVSKLIELFEFIGLNEAQIFCSSVTGYNIPLGEDIYDYLRQQFQNYNLHVVFMLSDNYYDSIACMNEMGAAWILQNKYTTILLPGFEFKEIEGAINPRQISLKLDNDLTDVKDKLGQLKDTLIKEFGLSNINSLRWEQKRDEFINDILNNNIINKLSDKAIVLLKTACSYTDAEIIKTITLSGVSICVRNNEFIASQERREVVEWESALKELLVDGYIEQIDNKGRVFAVTKQGFNYIDQVGKL